MVNLIKYPVSPARFPCPKCGGKTVYLGKAKDSYLLQCKECGHQFHKGR